MVASAATPAGAAPAPAGAAPIAPTVPASQSMRALASESPPAPALYVICAGAIVVLLSLAFDFLPRELLLGAAVLALISFAAVYVLKPNVKEFVDSSKDVFGMLMLLGIAVFVWHYFSFDGIMDHTLHVIENGKASAKCSAWDESGYMYKVNRSDVVVNLTKLLRPNVTNTYTIVVGESGTGKSTIVCEAVRQLIGGVVYFETPLDVNDFGIRLASRVGLELSAFKWSVWLQKYFGVRDNNAEDSRAGDKTEPHLSWDSVDEALETVAAKYKTRHGHPMTLVIDATDWIAKKSPGFLRDLQQAAKRFADKKTLLFVFVTSEDSTLPIMLGQSEWSRGKIFEVSDISDEQAMWFLTNHSVPYDRAADAVSTITGGRFVLLNNFIETYINFDSNEAYRRTLDDSTADKLVDVGIYETHDLFKKLVQQGSMRKADAKRLMSAEQVQALLNKNVLSLHGEELTLHSRHVQTYFERMMLAAEAQ